MTFEQLVLRTMQKLNYTSEEAQARVGERINEVYKAVTSGIGLITARRVETEVEYDAQDVGSTLPLITVDDMEKILTVRLKVDDSRPKVLNERDYNDVKGDQLDSPNTGTPQAWAVKRMGSNSVVIIIDRYPETAAFTLQFEGYELADELADDAEPAFPESFHDLLIEGARAEELFKLEKPQLALAAAAKYEKRLSDLRFFIAKSQWLDVVQGKNKRGRIRGNTVVTNYPNGY